MIEIGLITFKHLFSLIAGWIVASLTLFIAGKVVAGREATLKEAFLIALVGPFLVTFSWYFSVYFIHPLIGLFIAFIVWIGVIKSFFGVGWLAAIAIALLASFLLLVVALISALLLGITLFLTPI